MGPRHEKTVIIKRGSGEKARTCPAEYGIGPKLDEMSLASLQNRQAEVDTAMSGNVVAVVRQSPTTHRDAPESGERA
jgi:hypothetical protein